MHQTAAHLLLYGLLMQSNCTPTPQGGGDGNQQNPTQSGTRHPPQPQHSQPLQPPRSCAGNTTWIPANGADVLLVASYSRSSQRWVCHKLRGIRPRAGSDGADRRVVRTHADASPPTATTNTTTAGSPYRQPASPTTAAAAAAAAATPAHTTPRGMQQPVTRSHPTTTGATAQHAMSHPTTRPPIRGTRHTTARRQPHTTATHHRQPGDQDSTPTQLSRSRPTARQPRTPATPSQTRHSQHGTTRKASRGQYRARRCPPKNARCHRCTSPTPSHCHPSTDHRQKHHPLFNHHQNWRATTPTPTRHHPLTPPLAQALTQHRPTQPLTANMSRAQDNRTPAATRTLFKQRKPQPQRTRSPWTPQHRPSSTPQAQTITRTTTGLAKARDTAASEWRTKP